MADEAKKLVWDVKHPSLSTYTGRGNSPQAALQDLIDSVKRGVTDAKEKVESDERRVERLETALADLPQIETNNKEETL